MTLFEFIVPVIALVVAATGVWLLRRSGRHLDHSQRHHRED